MERNDYCIARFVYGRRGSPVAVRATGAIAVWQWSCECGENGTAPSFNTAYLMAVHHGQHYDHPRFTVVSVEDMDAILTNLIAEAEAIIQDA